MDQDEIRRRIRAARALVEPTAAERNERNEERGFLGITIPELAARLQPEWPVSAKTVGAVERGEREVRPMELRAIAAACGLPYEFFTADLAQLAASGDAIDADQIVTAFTDRLDERLTAFAAEITGAAIDSATDEARRIINDEARALRENGAEASQRAAGKGTRGAPRTRPPRAGR